ncbi:MAG: metal ABC transporter ATP-binding protein [Prochloron sp. SP5CPC1]|nr:metal ABC transporter ATP-binding protein [Candidatus Paraprochloron terpiosi SP5CPC1]
MITDKCFEQAAVRVRHLSVLRGDYLALDSVSFDLLPGTHTAIIGPNGAGKSTLIKAILGLIPKTSGQVLIFGCTSKKLNKLRQGIGYIPQKFPFHGSFPLTVAEFVGLGVPKQGWFREKRRAVQQALERVNLHHLAKQKIGTLSGGELKRVLLAYCLVTPRRLLVLDEALAGVDQTGEAEFAALLALLKEELGWTILEVSHDLDSVKQCCDGVFCLNRKLLAEGCPHVTLTQENLQQVYGGQLPVTSYQLPVTS